MSAKKQILPEGWHYEKLKNVADVVNGFGFPEHFQGRTDLPFPFIKVSDMNREGSEIVISKANNTVDDRLLKEIGGKVYPAGTIIFPKVGGALLTNKKRILGTQATFDNNVMGVIPINVITRWVYYWFLTIDLKTISNTQALPSIKQSVVADLEIPIPSLEEQKRIAACLDEQMRHIEQARQAAEESLSAAWELPSAYMKVIFEGEKAKNWEKQRLAEVTEIISGITLGRKLGDLKTRKVPYLRVANVKDGFLDFSDIKEIDATDADIKKCTLKYGDLLLTEGGDPDKLGRGTFWEEQIPECLHQNHIFRVRFDLNKFSPQFAAYQFGSAYGKAYFLAHAKQTTGIATINQKVLGNFPFINPPFNEQKRIAETIKAKIDEANKLIASLESQLAEINELPSALLRQAFAGQL
jgi:type I restriction enzyme, S subunit